MKDIENFFDNSKSKEEVRATQNNEVLGILRMEKCRFTKRSTNLYYNRPSL